MIPELGNLSLVLALLLSAVSGACGLGGARAGHDRWMRAAGSATLGQFVFTALAFAVLVHAFVTDDFSVAYVAHNSNSLLPWYYKVSAVWGAHEGSFLLWILIMTLWMTAVTLLGRRLPLDFHAGSWVSWLAEPGLSVFSGVHQQPVRAPAAPCTAGRRRSQPVVAGLWPDRTPADAVHGLRWFLGSLRFRGRGAPGRPPGRCLGALVETLDE